jgi:hypothetical protein
MNDREKKLVVMLGATAFAIVNLALYFKLYEPMRNKARKDIVASQATLKNADIFLDMRDQYADEIDWLEKHQPKTAPPQEIDASLQRFAQSESLRNGLKTKPRGQRILPSIQDPGLIFARSRVEQNVTGREDALYRWLYRLQTPSEFRAITALRLAPDREDDTLIDCKVVVEEWFIDQDPMAQPATQTPEKPEKP